MSAGEGKILEGKILEVEDLRTHFALPQGTVRSVDGASLSVAPGETVGIVGESGCGKSVLLRSILRIVPRPGKVVSGAIRWRRKDGDVVNLCELPVDGREIRMIRGGEIAMIFQEPMSSLSPVHTIGNQIVEAIMLRGNTTPEEAWARAVDTLARVAMPRPEMIARQYPHELSGGMRQRAMIAMALSCDPRLLMADEPTTALDVTTQAQILALMRRLQREAGMAILFVTHDLGVVAQMTERVIVMYLGKVVESGPVADIFAAPLHPYTHALLHSIPRFGLRQKGERLASIPGSIPDPYSVPRGCAFHARCRFDDKTRCRSEVPPLREIAPGRAVRCHRAEELGLSGMAYPEPATATAGP